MQDALVIAKVIAVFNKSLSKIRKFILYNYDALSTSAGWTNVHATKYVTDI